MSGQKGSRQEEILHMQSPPCRVPNRNVIKDDFGGKLLSGRPFRSDVRGRRLDVGPRTRFPRRRVFTVRRRGKNRVCADAKKKFKKK
jgi:hypothetical protein